MGLCENLAQKLCLGDYHMLLYNCVFLPTFQILKFSNGVRLIWLAFEENTLQWSIVYHLPLLYCLNILLEHPIIQNYFCPRCHVFLLLRSSDSSSHVMLTRL